jgi:hypothetical protein
VFQKELYNGIPNVTVWRVLRKRLHLKAYKLSIVQDVERWIVCTPLSIDEYHSKVFLSILRYQWKLHWTVATPGKTRCALLHYDTTKYGKCSTNKFTYTFKVVKLFLNHPVFPAYYFQLSTMHWKYNVEWRYGSMHVVTWRQNTFLLIGGPLHLFDKVLRGL